MAIQYHLGFHLEQGRTQTARRGTEYWKERKLQIHFFNTYIIVFDWFDVESRVRQIINLIRHIRWFIIIWKIWNILRASARKGFSATRQVGGGVNGKYTFLPICFETCTAQPQKGTYWRRSSPSHSTTHGLARAKQKMLCKKTSGLLKVAFISRGLLNTYL